MLIRIRVQKSLQLGLCLLSLSACGGTGEIDSAEPLGNAGEQAEQALEPSAGGRTARPDDDTDAASGAESGGAAGTEPATLPGYDACVPLTAEEYENNEGNKEEFTAKFFPTENRNDEYIDMFFRSGALGVHNYGEADNADLYTCDQCLFIVRNGKKFYPVSGSIDILEGSDPMGTTLIAEIEKLTLIEITISDSYHSIPVDGGECVTLAAASIDTTN